MKILFVCLALLSPLAERAGAHNDDTSITAPMLEGITIDGKLKDWPAVLKAHPIPYQGSIYGETNLEGTDLATSTDLSPWFKVGYSAKDQVLYLAITVRDDQHVLEGPGEFYQKRDYVEVYIDGDHSGGRTNSPADALQYLGLAGDEQFWPNSQRTYVLWQGDITRTQTRMAYQRSGDQTTYEWAIQAFDRYPDQPSQLLPGKSLGFDIAIIDRDGDGGNAAWVSWTPKGGKFRSADLLGDLVLGDRRTLGGPTGALVGTATDSETQTAVPDLALVAYQDDQGAGAAYTSAEGHFRLYLPPGDYTLQLQPGQGYQMAPARFAVHTDAETPAELALTPIHLPAALQRAAALYANLDSYSDSNAVEIDEGLESTTSAFAWQKGQRLRLENLDWASGNLTGIYSDGHTYSRYETQHQQYIQLELGEEEDLSFAPLADSGPGLRLVQQLILADNPQTLLRTGLDATRHVGSERLRDFRVEIVDLTLLATGRSVGTRVGIYQPLELRLWIDAQTHAIRQVHYQVDGRPYSEYYHQIGLNPPLAADHFRFDAPPDAEEVFYIGVDREEAKLIGQQAPDFALKDYQGTRVSLSDFAGQVLLIDFWGTWCPPCRMATPHLMELHDTYAEKGFNIIGIATQDQADKVSQYAAENEIDFPLPLADNAVPSQYGVHNFPTMFLLDKQGVIRYVQKGYSEGMKTYFASHIEELLAE